MSTAMSFSCPDCGQVSFVPVRAAFVSGVARDRTVAWICLRCDDVAFAGLTEADSYELVSHGAHEFDETSDWRPPHPESRRDGPVLDADALIDLDALLRSDSWLPALMADLRVEGDSSRAREQGRPAGDHED